MFCSSLHGRINGVSWRDTLHLGLASSQAGRRVLSANKQLIHQPMRRRTMGRIHVFAAVELLLGENRTVMGEGQETFLTVIVPHTGITNPTERQVVLGHM